MVLRDSKQSKNAFDSPLMDTQGQMDNKDELYRALAVPKGTDDSPPGSSRDFQRGLSPMQEVRKLEHRWQQTIQRLDEILTKTSAEDGGKLCLRTFCAAFRDEVVLELLFNLFDWEDQQQFSQEKLVDSCRFTVKGVGSREWVELVDVVAYVVCGENKTITGPHFSRIFKSKEVLEKLFKVISKEDGGYVSKTKLMDLIANLTYARSREGFTKENLEHLETLFRQALGTKQELSFEDFKKIVKSKNSFFAERVFNVFDRDKSGTVSLCEFLDAMHQFTGKSPNDKIQFLFRVYDLDGDGLIQREELEKVMKACMEENGMDFSNEQIEDLTVALFEDADTENRGEITFEDLKAQLQKHTGLLENLSISIDRWLVPPPVKAKSGSLVQRMITDRPYQLTTPYLKNNYVYLTFLFCYIGVNLGMFIDRAVDIANAGHNFYYVVARACGHCLNFNCAFILVLVLRQTLTFLRSRGASAFLPLDQHLYFHKMCGFVIFFHSSVHTLMHLINFSTVIIYSESLNPDGEYSLAEWLLTSKPGKFGLVEGWANPTGIILMLVLIVMVICSMPFVRKSGCFEVFYWTHLLYVVFFVLTILHGPHFWKWVVGPGIIFLIEKIYRRVQMQAGYRKTYISSGILLPSKVIHLVVHKPQGFHFHPGDYVFVNIPTIAKYEWHPFTVSSAPEQEDAVWLHIRAVGEWTNRLYSYFEKQQIQCEKNYAHKRTVYEETRIVIDGRTEPMQLQIEDADRERKNGIVNRSYDPEITTEHDSDGSNSDNNKEDSNRAQSTPPAKLPQTKKNVSKTLSMPDIKKKMKKRERNLILRDNFRTNSANNMNPSALKQAHNIIDEDPSSILFPTNRSVVQSFRYMRRKPKVVTLDMPEDVAEDENEHDSDIQEETGEEHAAGDNKVKPTVVRLTSARVFRRRKSTQTTPSRKEQDSRRMRRQSRMKEAESFGQCTIGQPLVIYLDGAYGAPSSHIFRAQHAVLIGTGIGVTPFASILQSIMHRYLKARQICPNCDHAFTADIPQAIMNLRKVDFFWINRDQRSFEWFVNLLSQLEIEQAEQGGVLERFLDMHMYITSALQRTDMKAVGLQLAMDLLHEKEKRDLITGLKTRTNAGRPNWDKVFKQLSSQRKGKVTVFYCGPPALARTLRYKCGEYGFEFRKENF